MMFNQLSNIVLLEPVQDKGKVQKIVREISSCS